MRGKRGFLKWCLGIIFGLFLLLGGLFVFNRVEYRDLDQYARKEAGGAFVHLDQSIVHYHLEGPTMFP